MVSIVDIAERAGVSAMTVSRVINNEGNVAQATARRVKDAMQALDYTPQAVRPGPKSKKRQGIYTGTIAFLSTRQKPGELYHMPALPALIAGIQEKLLAYGMELILAHAPGGKTVPPCLFRNRVDGVLLFGQEKLGVSLKNAIRNIPAVWCFRSSADTEQDFDHVFYKNLRVGQLAADYLFDHGHEHTAFLSFASPNPAMHLRRDEFIKAMKSRGKTAEAIEIRCSANDSMSIMSELNDKLFSLNPRPTGVFCVTDNVMLSVFKELHRRGVEPERDIELIGCNNENSFLQHMHPRPATIDLKLDVVGREAVERLVRRMANPHDENRIEVLIQPSVVPGEKSEPVTDAGGAGLPEWIEEKENTMEDLCII